MKTKIVLEMASEIESLSKLCADLILELESHNHSIQVRVQGYDGWDNYTSLGYGVMFKANDTMGYHLPNYTAHSAVVTADSNTYGSGGSQPHNNMPPYLTVYMWKRVS